MEQKKDTLQNRILFWIYTAIIAVLVIGVIAVVILFAQALGNAADPYKSADAPETQLLQQANPTKPNLGTPPEVPDIPGNRYSEVDFAYEGDYLTCLAGESVLGIDVSSYQGQIDWEAVRQAGVEFVIIRVAGRGYGASGVLYDDDSAQANYEGATAAGLKVGAYFFSQAITVEEAQEEAAYILEKTAHWDMEMPIVFDWECEGEEYRTYGLSERTLTDCTLAFCQSGEEAGREAMIYFNPAQHNKQFYIEELTAYDFWLAMYSDFMTYPYHIDMWQYTRHGTVPGIDGDVDINLYLP